MLNINYVNKFDHGNLQWFSCVTCFYDSFWLMGMTTKINQEQVDAKIDFMHLYGSRKTFNWPTVIDTRYASFDDILLVISTTMTRYMCIISASRYKENYAIFIILAFNVLNSFLTQIRIFLKKTFHLQNIYNSFSTF